MYRSDVYRYYRKYCKDYLKENFETEKDFMQKLQKSIYCKFQRVRYNGEVSQCILGVKFKDSMNVICGYPTGMKTKKTSSSMGSLFS